MALGLFLILIVIIPFCIYLYITNKKLTQEVENLQKEKYKILERKVLTTNEPDIHSIETISQNTQPKIKELNNNPKENSTKDTPIKLTSYEQEQENSAIISYQELIGKINKNKKDEKSETEQFLAALKDFRKKLK